jgi:hypothetical protein
VRKRGRPKAKNPASVYVTVRVSRDQKERLERRAKMVGVKLSEYLRTRVLAELQTEAPATPEPIPGQTTVEEVAAAAEVEAEVAEAKLTDDPAREAFVERRAMQLYGQGRTQRLARVEAEAEWRNRGGV